MLVALVIGSAVRSVPALDDPRSTPMRAWMLGLLLLAGCGQQQGVLGGPCYGNGTCNAPLVCAGGTCVVGGTDGAMRDAGALDGGPDDAGLVDAGALDAGMFDAERPDGGTPDAGLTPGEGTLGGITIRRITARAAVIDPAGVPHVLVAGDALRHFWRVGPTWQQEVVAPHAELASAVLDGAGELVVAFLDRHARNAPLASDVQSLQLARHTASGWRIEPIAAEIERPIREMLEAPDVAVAPDGRIFVAYVDGYDADQRIALATRASAGGWTFETLASDPAGGYFGRAEVAIQASGEPMVAWSQIARVWIARRSAGGFAAPELAGGEATGDAPTWDFFADAAGHATFVYYTPYTSHTLHTRILREAAAGFTEQIADYLEEGWPAYSAALLDDGRIAFSLRVYDPDTATFRAGVSVASATSFTIDAVGTADRSFLDAIRYQRPPLFERGGLALAARGSQWILVDLEPATGELVVHRSTTAGSTWEREVLALASATGVSAAAAIDATGRAWAVGAELWRGAIEALREDGTAFAPIESLEDVPWHGIVTLDAVVHPSGDLLVAYSDGDRLSFARHGAAGWLAPSLIRTGTSTDPIRMVLDPMDRPAVIRGATLYRFDGASWLETTVPVSAWGAVEARSALAFDDAGLPVASLIDSLGNVVVARMTAGGSWTTETIEVTSPCDTAIALDSSGMPHVAFVQTQTDPHELRHAHRDATGWHVETVQALGPVGRPRSARGLALAIAPDGPAVIAFHSYVAGTARLAIGGAGTWSITDVGTPGDDGWFPDLALDGDEAVVAWHDRAAGDLRVRRIALP